MEERKKRRKKREGRMRVIKKRKMDGKVKKSDLEEKGCNEGRGYNEREKKREVKDVRKEEKRGGKKSKEKENKCEYKER